MSPYTSAVEKTTFSSGIRLEFNLEQEEYARLESETAGVRIVVKDQGEMPFPAEEGISLPPGFSAQIGLRKVSN